MARRRARGEGGIRCRPDGRYMGQVVIGYDDHSKRRRKSVYGRTRSEVAAKMAAVVGAVREGGVVDPSRQRLAVYLREWIDTVVREQNSDSLQVNYDGLVALLAPGVHPKVV